MSTLTVDNHCPKKIGFRGKELVLLPGENDVDEALFLKLWKTDPTMKPLFAKKAFSVEKGGKAYAPDDAPKQVKKTPKELTGPGHQVVSSLRTPPPAEPPAPPPDEVAVPNRVGAGVVPGTVPEATALIAKTDDVEQLSAWYAEETRAGVVPALETRLADLGALNGDG